MERRGNTTLYVKLKWEREQGVNISEDEWLHIWRAQQSTASSHAWRLFCWKHLIRFFITPKIQNKYLSVLYGATNVDNSHVFWHGNVYYFTLAKSQGMLC